jgi:hypothetical protein
MSSGTAIVAAAVVAVSAGVLVAAAGVDVEALAVPVSLLSSDPHPAAPRAARARHDRTAADRLRVRVCTVVPEFSLCGGTA